MVASSSAQLHSARPCWINLLHGVGDDDEEESFGLRWILSTLFHWFWFEERGRLSRKRLKWNQTRNKQKKTTRGTKTRRRALKRTTRASRLGEKSSVRMWIIHPRLKCNSIYMRNNVWSHCRRIHREQQRGVDGKSVKSFFLALFGSLCVPANCDWKVVGVNANRQKRTSGRKEKRN